MAIHKIYDLLNRSNSSSFPQGLVANGNALQRLGQMIPLPGTDKNAANSGYTQGYGDTVPAAASTGWASGALFLQLNVAAGTQCLFVNQGSVTSSLFTKVTNIEDQVICSVPVAFLAANTIQTLFVARSAWQITGLDYVGDVQDGGAITATAVKATGTNAPSSGTTPLCTAAAIKIGTGGTANTVQPITLTSTAADLLLAAGDRAALVLSAAGTAWHGVITIKGRRQ